MQRAAATVHVPIDLVADAEQRKPLLRRIFGSAVDMAGASIFAFLRPEERSASDDYRELIQQAIHRRRSAGTSSSSPMRPRSPWPVNRVLRVLMTASRSGQRLTEEWAASVRGGKLAREGDRASADYLKRFYGVKEELPAHYDLVVNTDLLAPDDAAALVLVACDRSNPQPRSGRGSG